MLQAIKKNKIYNNFIVIINFINWIETLNWRLQAGESVMLHNGVGLARQAVLFPCCNAANHIF